MIITLGQAREAVARFVGRSGKCADLEEVRLFVISAIQELLHQGSHGNERKWCFCICDGCFTAPEDMEVPLRVKIDGFPDHVWSKWYEFFDVHANDTCDDAFKSGMYEEVNRYFTIYDIPSGGARVAVMPLVVEKPDAYIIVQGVDHLGREVYTTKNGKRIYGECIKINKDSPVYSRTTFSKITGIEKSETRNYVRLYWQKVNSDKKITSRGLLAEYKPTDINPSFRRFRVPGVKQTCCAKITVIGRVKVLNYTHDNEILPITNLAALQKQAQLKQAEENKEYTGAAYFQQSIAKALEEENQYYRTGAETFDINWDTSAGSIENLQ